MIMYELNNKDDYALYNVDIKTEMVCVELIWSVRL